MYHLLLGTTIRYFVGAVAAVVLTACGGGGDGDGGGFLGPDTTPTYTLSLQSFDPAGNKSTSLSRATPLTIIATLKEDGNVLAGEAVALTTSIGTVFPDNGSALTDENGEATFEVSYSGVVGAGEVTATFSKNGESAEASIAIQSEDIGSPYRLEITTTAPNGVATQAFSERAPLQVQATLFDVTGPEPVPLEGELLSLSSTIGEVAPDNGSALTDASGTASFTVSSDDTQGAGVLSVEYTPTDADPVQRNVNIESRADANFYTLNVQTLAPDGSPTQEFSSSEPLTVRVELESIDASVSGQLVALSSTIGEIAPSNGQSLTDENGVALFELSAGTEIGAGVVTANFNIESEQIEASALVERVAAEINRDLSIELFGPDGSPRSTFNEDEPLTVRVSIVDGSGDIVDVDDEIIDVTASVGALAPENGRKLTVDGVAEFQLAFDNVVGAGQVTARYALPEGTLIETANVEAYSLNAGYVLTMVKSGGNALGQITETSPVTVTVQLLDGVGGAPVAGEIVKLSTSVADIDPQNGEAVTNASGRATFELIYSGVDGAGVVTAEYLSADDELFSNSINVESVEQAPPYRLSFTAINGIGFSSNQFNANTPLQITVRLTDDAGRVLPGERITLDSTIGTVEPANGVAITDSQGRANFSLIGTGSTGAGAVIARYEGELGEVVATTNAQEVTTPADYVLEITDVGGGIITESSPIVVTVRLTSAVGEVAGQVIRLTSEVGAIDPENGASLTDANGIASFSLSYNGIVGAGIVTATFSSPEGQVSDFAGVQATAAGFDTGLAVASFDSFGNPTNELSTTSPLTVRVTLIDGAGNPIEVDNEIISLSSDIGVVTPATGSALTNAGVAEFTLSASGTLGAGLVTASYSLGGVSVVKNYAVQVVSGDLYTLTLETSGGNLSASNPLTITVVLQDDNGVVQPNEIITASASLGNLVASSAVTDGNGEAVFTLEYGGEIGAGLFVASYDTPDGVISNSININSVEAPPPYLLQLESLEDLNGNPTNEFSSNSPLIVTVRLLETDGVTPVSNSVVGLTSTLGSISPSNGTSLTNNEGRAIFTLTGGGETGAGVIVASYDSGTNILTVQRNVQAVAANQNYALALSVTNNGVITPSSSVQIDVTLTSTDATLYPVANQVINLESAIGAVNPDNGSARTDGSGVASFVIDFDGVVGAGQVTATYEASGGSVTAVTAIESSSPDAVQSLRITTVSGAGLNPNEFGPNEPLTIEVAILDDAGNVDNIDGQLIDLATTIGDLSPPNGRALTTNGVATFVLYFDGTVGGGELTAQWNAGVATIQVTQPVQAVVDNNFQLSITQLTSGDLSINNPLTFEVELLNEDGSPAASEAVELSVVNGSLSQGTVLTDNNGLATVVVTYGGQAGAGSLTGQFSSLEGTFTNTLNFRSVDEAPAYVLNIVSLTDPNGVATTEFSDKSPLTILVRLTEADGTTPVEGELIDLDTTIGFVSDPELGSRVTDANGEAVFTVDSLGTSGAGTITATYESPVGSVTARRNVQSVDADDIYTLTITNVTNNGVVLDGSPVTVTAQLSSTNTANYPIENQIISTSGLVVFNVEPLLDGRTDASGEVQFEVYADSFVGAETLTLRYDDAPNGSVTASTTLVSQLTSFNYNLQIVTTNPSGSVTNQLSAISPMTVTVTVIDDTGATVDLDGEPIRVSSDLGGVDVDTSEKLTVDGVAVFTLTSNGLTGAGTLTVSYLGDPLVLLTATQNIEAVVENPYTVSLASSGGDLSINNPLTLTATVLDEAGDPVVGEDVSLSTTVGSLDRFSALTDASGEAQFTLTYLFAEAGEVTATVTSAEGTFTNTLNVNAVDEAPDYAIAITELLAPDGVTASNSFSSSTPLTVVVSLSSGGFPLADRPVRLALGGLPGIVLPGNNTAITDAGGEARFEVQYGGQTGAGEITVTYQGPLGDVEDTAVVQAVVADLEIGSLDDAGAFVDDTIRAVPSTSVSYLGSVELLLAVTDSATGELVTTNESLRIESPCLLNGFATLSTGLEAAAVSGLFSTTYTAGENCQDTTDTVTATLLQAGVASQKQATVTLSLAAAPAADERFITFVEAAPVNLALRGTGGGTTLSESGLVTFLVQDGSGNPVSGQDVTFSLSTDAGGLELASASGTTDTDGLVRATVFAGTVPTPVRVIATTERSPSNGTDDLISVVSDALSVSAGIASQERFTIAASVLNPPQANCVQGIESTITVLAGDRFGNPVPQGTAINFTADCGVIGADGPAGACQIGADSEFGECAVTWKSQPGAFDAAQNCSNNRVTIMAWASGEEIFFDQNGNNLFDPGTDSFTDNSEAFRDTDENTTFTSALPSGEPEFFVDNDNDGAGLNGVWDGTTPTPSLFNGLACLEADNLAGNCSRALVSVYDQLTLVAGACTSGELVGDLQLTSGGAPADPLVVPEEYTFYLQTPDGNPPPAGTTIRATGTGSCTVPTGAVTVLDTSAASSYAYPFVLRTEAAGVDNFLEIIWQIPGGNEVSQIYNCP